MLLLTGQRSGEVCRAKWEDIKDDIWSIPETKSGKAHKIPLSPQVVILLENLKKEVQKIKEKSKLKDKSHFDIYVFPSLKKSHHIEWTAKACNRLEIKLGSQFTPHDLRRTAATIMGELEISDQVISKILNHAIARNNVTRRVYNRHDQVPQMREALNNLAAEIIKIVENGK